MDTETPGDAPSDGEFSVQVGDSGNLVVIAPNGELDIATTPELADAFAASSGGDVVVDLRGVSFMDSSGIACVLEAWRVSTETGGRLRAVEGPPEVQRVLGLVALDRQLDWVDPPEPVSWRDAA